MRNGTTGVACLSSNTSNIRNMFGDFRFKGRYKREKIGDIARGEGKSGDEMVVLLFFCSLTAPGITMTL